MNFSIEVIDSTGLMLHRRNYFNATAMCEAFVIIVEYFKERKYNDYIIVFRIKGVLLMTFYI